MNEVCDLVRSQLGETDLNNTVVNAYCYQVLCLPIKDALGFMSPKEIARSIVDYVLLIDTAL